MIVSRLAPAVSTISMISPWHHSVVTSLMRTQRVLRPQSRFLSAQLILLRASTFADGATASSRSQKTWSAADAAAFWSIFSLLPGTDSCDRRRRAGRLDMSDQLLLAGHLLLPAI